MEQGPAAGQQHVPAGSVQDLGGRPCSAASCIPPLPAWGPVVPGGQRQRWPGARAVVWWQREVGDAGTTEAGGVTGLARVVCFSVERHYYFSCLLWSLMTTAKGLCPTALGKSLQIWGGLVVPCRASSPFSARSGGAAASPAVCAWMGCLHRPLPQFPCLESSVEGTFPSLAGAGRHKQELCVPTVGRGLLWHRAGCGSHPAQALCPWGDGVASMGACRCGSGLTRDPALPRQRGGGAGIPRGPRTSPPAAAHPTTWGN